ncbi:hypothetical protein CYMTET_42769 [Cymbomonas tetramitiformis]|uniref:Uncharacterized protein n=1 Tax=Cymbomonas tetramitiformis TaxID=36881 RepID=A0AAE0C3I8_9CHLO|nr:hypothetical protein CYMTET_42769 [Cymbomonas tetramitiformis]|eukprot:gene282-541_t
MAEGDKERRERTVKVVLAVLVVEEVVEVTVPHKVEEGKTDWAARRAEGKREMSVAVREATQESRGSAEVVATADAEDS